MIILKDSKNHGFIIMALLSKYYQNNKEKLQRKLVKDINVFIKKKKEKNNNMIVNNTKTYHKLEKKS